MITGAGDSLDFSAPVDLYVGNISNDITPEAITDYMKSSKNLVLLECVKISHPDARSQSFRVKVKGSDHEVAMSAETWPARVKVRTYRHPRFRNGGAAQFGQAS